LCSQYATDVFLLLFDTADGEPTDIIRLEERGRSNPRSTVVLFAQQPKAARP
jgi:hypothetical protein